MTLFDIEPPPPPVQARGERWVAYCGRAEDVLPTLPKDVVLLVTDPPYGIDHQSGWRPQPISGDGILDRQATYAVLTQSVALFGKANQHLYVFGNWELPLIGGVFKGVQLVWDKVSPAMGDIDVAWSRNYELIQFGVGHKASRTKSDGLMRKRRGAVLRQYAITGTRAYRHPMEKPVPLLRDLIEASSQFGDVVLDPYMGSGSTGVAAILEGRKFTGIEIEPKYFAIACERLRRAEQAWLSQEGL